MTISSCTALVDPSGRELVEHGTAAFPIACYDDPLAIAEVPWHWHEELEAGIITQGTAVITIGQEKLILRAGEGFFINSGILHGAYAPDQNDCRIHSLVFHSRLVGGSSDSIFHQRFLLPLTGDPTLECVFFSPDEPWHREALTAIKDSWEFCRREEPGYEFQIRTALSRLIWLLNRNHEKTERLRSGKNLRDSDRIKRMLSFIHEHYRNEVTINSIAASSAISESECLRCFRSTIGISPIQYLKQYRIRQAASRILSSDEHIADIAVQCGFQDMSYFSKAFREAKGCSPSQYRRNHKRQP